MISTLLGSCINTFSRDVKLGVGSMSYFILVEKVNIDQPSRAAILIHPLRVMEVM